MFRSIKHEHVFRLSSDVVLWGTTNWYDRIDIVFDRYFDSSLKEDTRSSRDSGTLLKFDENTDIPQDMADNFLKNSENKNNLGEFLAKKMIDNNSNNLLILH